MKFTSFKSKRLTFVAAIVLMSVSADPAFSKDHHTSKGFRVIAVRTLDNAKTTDLLLLNRQGGRQLLYLASADGKLSLFDVTHPRDIREVATRTMGRSGSGTFRLQAVNDRFVVASDSKTNDKPAVLDLSDAASSEIARQFAEVDAYAVDDKNQVLYVAQPGELTVVRFDHPFTRDAELFEESYEAR